MGCSALVSIIIPENVVSIGTWAFSGCYDLASITIPSSVTDIGTSTFQFCRNLIITVNPDSYAEQYCKRFNLSYVYPDVNYGDAPTDWLFQ